MNRRHFMLKCFTVCAVATMPALDGEARFENGDILYTSILSTDAQKVESQHRCRFRFVGDT